MTAIVVDPAALSSAAGQLDDVAAVLARVHLSVRAQGLPDTGRCDTTALVSSVAEALAASVRGLGAAAAADADGVRAAAASYRRVDGGAMP